MLSNHYGEKLIKWRHPARGTCYNLSFATTAKDDDFNEDQE